MIVLSQYCVIYPEYFTERECDLIQAHAETLELSPGMVGNQTVDPDAENFKGGDEDNYIRQSDVKWMQHHEIPEGIQKKISDGINRASAEANWLHQWEF